MTWTRLVEKPQMSGPNMMEYGVSPPNAFMSEVDGISLMYPPPQSSFCSCFAENCRAQEVRGVGVGVKWSEEGGRRTLACDACM